MNTRADPAGKASRAGVKTAVPQTPDSSKNPHSPLYSIFFLHRPVGNQAVGKLISSGVIFKQEAHGIHRGWAAQASESATTVIAPAYPAAASVAFARCDYSPESDSGNALLAHELAHMIQEKNRLPQHVSEEDFCYRFQCPDSQSRRNWHQSNQPGRSI